ncbi:MAG: aminotransferase DegT [Planctomycetota bacterium]|nr:MAG: aminotransferase DegT [Planctomycetota bacterium]
MNQRPFHDVHRIPLARPWFDDAEVAAAAAVVRSGQLCQGPQTEAFEAEFAAKLNVRHAVAVSNGSVALLVALEAMGVTAGDEAIVPDMTFISTVTSAVRLGATPVFGDITLTDYNLDANLVERLVTPKTKVLIPVHYAGQVADMDALADIARRHNLKILEDAAEAHLARYNGGKFAGTIGDTGIFSFTPTKPMTTGEGGMIVTDNDEIADRCRLIRNFGDRGKFNWDAMGFNYRLNEVASAIGRCQLAKLDEIVAMRRAKARRYDEGFAACDLIHIPWLRGREDSNYQLYTIRLAVDRLDVSRDAIIAELTDRGISTRLYYPALHRQGVFRPFGPQDDRRFPNALEFERSALSLPIFSGLTREEQDYIIKTIPAVLAAHRK